MARASKGKAKVGKRMIAAQFSGEQVKLLQQAADLYDRNASGDPTVEGNINDLIRQASLQNARSVVNLERPAVAGLINSQLDDLAKTIIEAYGVEEIHQLTDAMEAAGVHFYWLLQKTIEQRRENAALDMIRSDDPIMTGIPNRFTSYQPGDAHYIDFSEEEEGGDE